MKKLIIGLILSLISISSFACHAYNDSYICGTTMYLHVELSANNKFQFRFYGADTTIIKEFETGNLIVDSILKFQIPASTTDVKMQFHNYYVFDTIPYNPWAGNYGSDNYFEVDSVSKACGTLGVSVSNLQTKKNNDNTINISFKAAEESSIDHYNVLASPDTTATKNWVKIDEIKATGAVSYSKTVNLLGKFSIAFLICGFTFYNKKRKWLSYILFSMVLVLFSCKKIVDKETAQSYKFIRIQPVSNTGTTSLSEIAPI